MPGKNGFLVPVQSAEALAEKAILLLQDPDLAVQMGVSGNEMVIDRFGIEKMIDAFDSVYSGMIQG